MSQSLNFQSQLNYKMVIHRCPTIQYNLQAVEIPSISVPAATIPTPFSNISEPGNKVLFSPLSLNFIVDENLESYNEIVTWMFGIGYPNNFDQYKQINDTKGRFSDLSVIFLASNKEPTVSYNFKDAWPEQLSGLKVNTTDTDVQYLTAGVLFNYSYYTIESLTS